MTSQTVSIPNRFDFATAQPRIYQMWQSGGYFHAEPDPSKIPFTIVIPPPNVTGALHLGHALNNTLQDIVIRLRRMQGYNTLWMPGTDHAGIATQAVVEKRIKEEEGKSRHDLRRNLLVARIWQWKEQYEARILGQLKQLGCSCDWERTRFTLDQRCAKAVRQMFFDLFNKRLIYRGKRLVNWDTFLQTAVSDDEVFNQTVQGHFWHCKYPVIDPKPGEPTHVLVATTRPETMLGDTAVAVHPDPASALEKYESELRVKLDGANVTEAKVIETQLAALNHRREAMLGQLEQLRDMALDGRRVNLPLMNRAIPIVTDTWAKPELGSGCVKITPAHDPNDYDVAQRCNLPMINILNPDGTLNAETAGYEGLNIKQARTKVVDDLDQLGLLDQVEDREIELPHSDRSKTPIEPFLADQWFVRMDQLAQSAIDAVQQSRVAIYPTRYEKGYLDWLGEKRDWPVSRQLWWGHQIPVWSMACQTQAAADAAVEIVERLPAYSESSGSIQIESSSETDDERRKRLGIPLATVHVCVKSEGEPLEQQLADAGFVRQQDVLDTWFSSALWPHSTLGWPDQTPELDYFYPTSVLITSRDIITLWVARMVLASLNNTGDVPFREVFIHPKILDGYGETMSKSKGNGIDPLDVIDKFGADALRFSMAHLTTETQDVRMPVQFECPHCGSAIEQTKKNRELPVVPCTSCKKPFSTQWARTDEEKALPRGMVTSERFEIARNFGNKLWNASRFAMMNLSGYIAAPIEPADLTIEDRWILSRLTTVMDNVTTALENYHFADATRELYDFAWHEFCSFYVEMLKERLSDDGSRAHAQRMLAFTLDYLLRMLHPIIPFITEEIWQLLAGFCPDRGFDHIEKARNSLMIAKWSSHPPQWRNAEIENQFATFQSVLGAVREIRSRQNLAPRKEIRFSVRCDDQTKRLLEPMSVYFSSMAAANLVSIGSNIEPQKTNATLALPNLEVFVDLAGLIDVNAETARLEKEKEKLEKSIAGKQNKLANEKFVNHAPVEIVQREREGLAKMIEQRKKITDALNDLN